MAAESIGESTELMGCESEDRMEIGQDYQSTV